MEKKGGAEYVFASEYAGMNKLMVFNNLFKVIQLHQRNDFQSFTLQLSGVPESNCPVLGP